MHVINNSQYIVSGSPGKGNWAKIPYICIFDKDITTSAQSGYYVVYLFNEDMSGFYISLSWGSTDFINKYGRDSSKYLRKASKKVRELLKNEFDVESFGTIIDLKSDGNLAKSYENGTIFSKYYNSEDIPVDEILITDLNSFLKLYDFAKNNLDINRILEDLTKNNEDKRDDMGTKINSFYEYLLDKNYLFDKKTIENYLLSLKVKPFAILTGNSGTGKTKLSQLFAHYLYDKNSLEDKSKLNSINTDVTVGKSFNSKGWSLNRNDLKALIPIDELDNSYSIIVDGIPAQANLKMNPRLFYKGNELKKHLKKLAEENAEQKVPLEILLDEGIINTPSNGDYITFKTDNTRLNEDSFALGRKAVNSLFGLEKYEGTIDISIDNIKSNEKITLSTLVVTWDKKLVNHLKSVDDLSDVLIKINKKDISDTYLDDSIDKKDKIYFERKMGQTNSWCLPQKELQNFLPIKNKYSWNAIIDGIETKLEYWIHDVCISLDHSENDSLLRYIDEKDENDTLKIEVDFSSFQYHGKESDNGVTFIDDVDEELIDKSSNYKIIPVGANWTENRNIIGFHNVITNEYQETPAYELIIQAQNSSKPHFLILDEMNLSHVERYFADFLSAIESGENIPLYGKNDSEQKKNELEIPNNLFIIGTVNVDETTYMFSPKVLDRANVLEFETYSAKDYMNETITTSPPDGDISYLENPLAGCRVRECGIDKLREYFSEVEADGEDFWELLSDEIETFQSTLKKSGFDFGFRVINEIVRFMAVAWVYEGKPSDFENWKRYFDAQIKQKMLPKLHGSEKIIGNTLKELYDNCLEKQDDELAEIEIEGEVNTVIKKVVKVKYPESANKLEEMQDVLRKQRYVSFIN